MTNTAESLRRLAVDLAWGLWAELGVSTWSRTHGWWCVELEPLIAFTAIVADTHDPRLLRESVDWCVRNEPFISRHQLRHVVKAQAWPTVGPIGAFGATVSRHTGTKWPEVDTEEPYDFQLSGKSQVPSLEQPALLQLRLRAVLGVSARAEIVRVLLTNTAREWSAAEIAERVAYTKRQVTSDLEMLTVGGVITRAAGPGGAAYVLADPDGVIHLVGKLPRVAPRSAPLFRSLVGLVDAVEAASAPGLNAPAAELARHMRDLDPAFRQARLRVPRREPDSDYLAETLGWVEGLFRRLADGDVEYLSPDVLVPQHSEVGLLQQPHARDDRTRGALSAEQILAHRDADRK